MRKVHHVVEWAQCSTHAGAGQGLSRGTLPRKCCSCSDVTEHGCKEHTRGSDTLAARSLIRLTARGTRVKNQPPSATRESAVSEAAWRATIGTHVVRTSGATITRSATSRTGCA